MSNVIDATEITVVEDKPSSSSFEPVAQRQHKSDVVLIVDMKKDIGGGVEASLKSFPRKRLYKFSEG